MNIYDIAGNVDEWTLESPSSDINQCASRGGSYFDTGSNNPAALRVGSDSVLSINRIGFRVSLFQEKLNARDEKFETRGRNKNDNRKL